MFKQRRLAGARKAEKEEEEEEAGSVAGRKLSDSLLKKVHTPPYCIAAYLL